MIRVSFTQHCTVHMKTQSSPFVADPQLIIIMLYVCVTIIIHYALSSSHICWPSLPPCSLRHLPEYIQIEVVCMHAWEHGHHDCRDQYIEFVDPLIPILPPLMFIQIMLLDSERTQTNNRQHITVMMGMSLLSDQQHITVMMGMSLLSDQHQITVMMGMSLLSDQQHITVHYSNDGDVPAI